MKGLLIIASIGMIIFGGQALLTAVTNTKAISVTIEEYHEKRPKGKWLELKGCLLNVVDSAYQTTVGSDRPTEVYIPIMPVEAAETDPVVVLLATKDKQILDLVEEMNRTNTEADAIKFMTENAERLIVEKDVKGLVRFGLDMDTSDRKKLLEIQPNLDKEFVLLDAGKRPSWLKVLLLPGGLALGYVLVFAGRKQPPPTIQQPPPALPPQQPQGPPPLG